MNDGQFHGLFIRTWSQMKFLVLFGQIWYNFPKIVIAFFINDAQLLSPFLRRFPSSYILRRDYRINAVSRIFGESFNIHISTKILLFLGSYTGHWQPNCTRYVNADTIQSFLLSTSKLQRSKNENNLSALSLGTNFFLQINILEQNEPSRKL